MKWRAAQAEPAEQAEETAGESDEQGSGRGSLVVLMVVALVAAWRVIVAFPYVAYFVAGVLATVGLQTARARWGKGRQDDDGHDDEAEQPDVGETLRRLVGDDKGVLLTALRDDLKLPDTKHVKALLKAAGIPWKAVRTREGNGPAVHREAIPPAPSPLAADTHGDGCCCRSDENSNSNNSGGEGPEKGIRVERIDGGIRIYDLDDNHRHHTVETPS
ncbi:hypothetical protein ACFY2J_34125 [Streptomyces collinus]|uniref:hypothetical protein n=1 Tax=Streptomyces collinus TaxID=42684 RepID=UPI003674A53C